MKFAFIFPAKIIFAERSLTPDHEFELYGYKMIGFSKNVYYCTKTNKIKTENVDDREGCYYYFIQINGVLSYIRRGFEDHFKTIEEDMFKRASEERAGVLNDPAKYEENQRVIIAEKRAEREREAKDREAKRLAKEAEELAIWEEKLKSGEKTLLNGDMIPWEVFEGLCNKYGYSLPFSTIGAGRKNIGDVGLNQYTTYKKTTMNVCGYARNLVEVIKDRGVNQTEGYFNLIVNNS